jgi:hypothetical protein
LADVRVAELLAELEVPRHAAVATRKVDEELAGASKRLQDALEEKRNLEGTD